MGFVILAVAIVLLSFLLRMRRDPAKDHLEIVQGLAAEARLDIRMAEVLKTHPSPRAFHTTAWQLHKKHISFLDGSLQKNLADAFDLCEDYNKAINAAKKIKSYGSLSSVDIKKLKETLSACQEGLEQWMLLKVGSRTPPVKGPSMFDVLIGKH